MSREQLAFAEGWLVGFIFWPIGYGAFLLGCKIWEWVY